jgi:anti-sigma B factor antagonist
MGLQLDSRVVGDVLIVRCAGRIVAGNDAQALHDRVKAAISETPDVVLHLAEVSFIDSSGLGTIVRLMTYARSCGGDLKLCHIPDMILKTLRMTNLHTLFVAYPSEAEAIVACYQHRQSSEKETFHAARRIVCFAESADVLAYVGELLRRAQYSVLTSNMLPDAEVLIKAVRPDLIIVGAHAACGPLSAQEVLRKSCPKVPILTLKEGFSTGDAGEAGIQLLEQIRRQLPPT